MPLPLFPEIILPEIVAEPEHYIPPWPFPVTVLFATVVGRAREVTSRRQCYRTPHFLGTGRRCTSRSLCRS